MHRRLGIAVLLFGSACAVIAVTAGCGGHSAQAPPPPGGEGTAFVGVDVCKVCHSLVHADWTTTAHSTALSVLQAIGQADNPQCLPCHTVGFGQPTGFVSQSKTPQLANVQCENCHGAGGKHVTNPSLFALQVPLAASLCGTCHQQFHHPTYEQWQQSGHAQALETLRSSPFAQNSCLVCHSVEAFLATGPEVVLAVPQQKAENPITCALCHDPHGSPNDMQLRMPVTEICILCHTEGGTLPGGTPHHPQREMLLGLGGFEVTGDPAIGPNSAHTTVALSRCVTCHVVEITPPNPTPANPVQTGHTFLPLVPKACQQCHPGRSSIQAKSGANQQIGALAAQVSPYLTPGDPKYIDPSTLSGDALRKYQVAKFNFDFVTADMSGGVHNENYAEHLLDVSLRLFGQL
jgi:predicted CXXCH cytochrome family protein